MPEPEIHPEDEAVDELAGDGLYMDSIEVCEEIHS
jgi:hypothetical protein